MVLSVITCSCITVKMYKMEPNFKVEPKNSILKKSALISSGMLAPLICGDTEILFLGEDASELHSIDFSDSLVSLKHSNKRVFVFKTKDADEAIRWVTQLGDSLELQEQDASKFSSNSVIISEDKKNIRFNSKIKLDHCFALISLLVIVSFFIIYSLSNSFLKL